MPRRFRSHRAPRAHTRVSTRPAAGVSMESMEGRVLLATFMVTNVNDSGSGSLRQAILNANKTTAADTIKFAIGSGAKTISPRSKLPGISQPTLLDATTQPGFSGKPLIEISGTSAGSSAEGLKLTGTGITVKGLAINRFNGFGIFIWGKGGNKIVGCYIGTDRAGNVAAGNKSHGIIVQSPNNTIGGLTSGDRNVISGNGTGVFLYTSAAKNTKVIGNYVGTDASGTKAIGNLNVGVQVNGGSYNSIGGTVSGSRNVISGNKRDGVLIVSGGSQHNSVQGNYIGTNAAGTGRLGNGWYGVEISQANNVVGGTTAAARNVISANGMAGVVIYLSTGINNKVQGNYIGTDYTGRKDLGNTWAGVEITNGAKNNTIGGDTAACRNIIAGNDRFGVGIYNGSTGNKVMNNRIGICAAGCALLNGKNAVSISNASSNTVRLNAIACMNGYKSIQLNSSSATTTSNTLWSTSTAGLKLI